MGRRSNESREQSRRIDDALLRIQRHACSLPEHVAGDLAGDLDHGGWLEIHKALGCHLVEVIVRNGRGLDVRATFNPAEPLGAAKEKR